MYVTYTLPLLYNKGKVTEIRVREISMNVNCDNAFVIRCLRQVIYVLDMYTQFF